MRKTSLTCYKCKKPIMSNEGFIKRRGKCKHMMSCKNPLKNHQVKHFVCEDEKPKQTFIIPEVLRGYRL